MLGAQAATAEASLALPLSTETIGIPQSLHSPNGSKPPALQQEASHAMMINPGC